MRGTRVLAPVLLVVLVLGVAAAIVFSIVNQSAQRAAQQAASAVVTVHGLVGSEKKDYLTDPRVLAILRANDIDLQIETSGSRGMALRTDLANYDFGFPAGVPAAKQLIAERHATQSFSPFYTPMAVASWKPIAEILIANGIVKKDGDDYYIIDMKRLLQYMSDGKRWDELAHHDAYDVGKSILISSTDVRSSNSAAMYLSLVSYLENGNDIVQNDQQAQRAAAVAGPLFLRQGYQESSSAGPFDDYTTIGMGKSPLVMVYEAQFIEYLIEHPSARDPNMVLMYPKPTIYTKHVLVPFDDKGAKLGALLESNPDLQKLAVEHGLRTSDADYAQAFWRKNGVRAPRTLIDVIDPPSYDNLEAMIRLIEKQFNSP
jgi:hypothetical protein